MPKAAKQPDIRRDFERELVAAEALKAQLRDILGADDGEGGGLDAQTLRDTIEGETNLLELMQAVIAQIGEDAAAADGIKAYIGRLTARKSRLDNRIETLRTMLANALEMIGGESHKVTAEALARLLAERAMAALAKGRLDVAIATVSLKAVPPKLVIADEAQVPAAYFRQPDPEIDKAALTADLKARAKARDAAIADIEMRFMAREIEDEAARALIAEVIAAHPTIPGAGLGNGSITIQLRFN